MATLEERVAFLEGRVGEQGRAADGIREAVVQLEHRVHAFEERMDRRFEAVDGRFQAIEARFDARFQSLDLRLDGMERRLDGLDAKMGRRFEAVEDKISRHFVWLVGIQVTTLAAIVAALATR